MAKGFSNQDLKQRIVCTEQDALRVGDASRLLPLILLRHDPRVERAFDVWRSRSIQYEEAGDFSEPVVMRALFEDSVQLNALVRELKLERYQAWLPRALRWEFQRALEGALAVKVAVPEGLGWESHGWSPKQKPGAMGGFRLENIEQHIERFYFCEVMGIPKKKLARDSGCSRFDVQHSVKRARTLLDCIKADRHLTDLVSSGTVSVVALVESVIES